jgi:hypothetical protein
MAPRALILFAGVADRRRRRCISRDRQLVVLGIVVLLHVIGLGATMLPVFKALRQGDKPDPVTEARLAEEGEASGRAAFVLSRGK